MWNNRSRLGAAKQLQEGMFRFVKKKGWHSEFYKPAFGRQ